MRKQSNFTHRLNSFQIFRIILLVLSQSPVDVYKRQPQAKAPASKAAKTLDNPLLHALEGAVPLPAQEPAFKVYDDIRQKLIVQGMPADQIAFIHEANTEVRKKELFSKVRTGQVRVLMGSTAKMGAGTNVQDRLVALHDCLLYTSIRFVE